MHCNLRSPNVAPVVLTFSYKAHNAQAYIQCVSKNIPDIFSGNFRKHCRIFILFGTDVTEKVSNQ